MSEEQSENQPQPGLDEQAQQKAFDAYGYVKASADQTHQALEDGISAASGALKTGAVTARQQYDRAYERSQTFLDTGIAHTQAGLDTAFGKLKEGVQIARDHPNASYAIGGAAAILIFPGIRRSLWRNTVGRFQSEEALFKSAEIRATHLKENLDFHIAEQQKLNERLAAAQEQYNAGYSKLVATNKQLQSLLNTVNKTESKASTLVQDLRELPSSQALKLRADVAINIASVKKRRSELEKDIYKLSKKGF